MTYKAHKIALNPTNKQRTHFARACGTARFAYNWALAKWIEKYKAGEKVSEGSLRKELNSIKKQEFPWMLEVSKCAPQQAIINLGEAFKRFFNKSSKYPRFKKKGIRDSFTLTNDVFKIEGKRIQIPKLGWVRMTEPLRYTGKLISATISRTADKWFVSIIVDVPQGTTIPCENQAAVGIDLGVETFATLSNGEKVVGPKAHKALLGRLKRLSRSLSRKVKGSKNRDKAKRKLARLHARIANIRKDFLHKFTTKISSEFSTVVIEDLNTKGMSRSSKGTKENPSKNVKAKSGLNRSIMDQGFHEFRRQLEYKLAERGGKLVVASRWFPSSKTCSCCGHKVESLPLSVRSWECSECGSVHDRDINAAKNLKNLAVSSTATACGEDVRLGITSNGSSEQSSMKQEDIIKITC